MLSKMIKDLIVPKEDKEPEYASEVRPSYNGLILGFKGDDPWCYIAYHSGFCEWVAYRSINITSWFDNDCDLCRLINRITKKVPLKMKIIKFEYE